MRIITLLAFGLLPATGLAQQPAEPSATPDHDPRSSFSRTRPAA
jgi:hypothetical protein